MQVPYNISHNTLRTSTHAIQRLKRLSKPTSNDLKSHDLSYLLWWAPNFNLLENSLVQEQHAPTLHTCP